MLEAWEQIWGRLWEKTEQETWYDPEDKSRSASIAGMDRDEVLEISPRKMGHGNGGAV